MAINQEPSVDVQSLTPFKKFIMTIGAIPTSYLESMTYAELLMWFCDYLQNTVIPTVNNNADAVEELQSLYEQLENYVNDYFDNLDIQDEINHKLDEMATDGTLMPLFNQYYEPIVQAQNQEISNFKNSVNNSLESLDDKVDALSSASPAGVYPTLATLQTDNPSHDSIYVVLEDGKWYYYDTTLTAWTAGGTYQSTGIGDNTIDSLKLKNESVIPIKIKDYVIGKNKYDKTSITMGYQFDSDGSLVADAGRAYCDYIYVGGASSIWFTIFSSNLSGLKICEYDENYDFLYYTFIRSTDFTLQTNNNYASLSPQASTKYIRFSFAYMDTVNNALQVEIDTKTDEYESYKWYINNYTHQLISNNQIFDKDQYQLPYIYNKKCVCNKVNNTRTAYYAGIETKENIRKIECNYIWENNDGVNSSGTLALIVNPNGVNRIKNITDLSIHATFLYDHFNVDIFGGQYIADPSTFLYQRVISQTYASPQSMDGETEHTVVIEIDPSTNTITCTVDSVAYTGTFTPDSNITGLNQVYGKYGIFEHYCDGNRSSFNMPMVTYFALKNINVYETKDYFDRENGQLTTSPTGQVYHLMNNGDYTA